VVEVEEINYGIPIQQIGIVKQDFGTQYKIKTKIKLYV
jgi:hypothetical protein